MRPACSVEKSARKAEEPDFAAGLLLLPSATLIAVLVNPTNPTIGDPFVRDLEAAASTLGLKLQVLHASTERDFDTVFATLAQLRAGPLVISPDFEDRPASRRSRRLPKCRARARRRSR
jgi:hypothetical protein